MKLIKKIIKLIIILILLGTLIFLYSKYLNAVGFVVHERTIHTNKLPKRFDGLKIVQISDINYGTSIKKEELKKIIHKINLTKPDIVLLTGDLLNENITYEKKDIDYITNQLKNINTSIDKYAIMGDQDYQIEQWETIINDSDFINLNDTYKIIYNKEDKILLSGISTMNNKKNTSDKISSTIQYLNDNDLYSILIIHEPDIVKNIDYDPFNLILAGHSLGGQFKLPLIGGIINKKGAKKYINEHYKIEKTDLYISNGLGNEKIEYRFLNKPSFNLFRIRSN